MDITAKNIQEILEISTPQLHNVTDAHGVHATYATKPLYQVRANAPSLPPYVNVSTLLGLADLVMAGLEVENFPTEYLIHVEDETTVTLKARTSDEYSRRQVLVVAKPVRFDQFKFNAWMSQEEFAIAIASKFADLGDKDYVLKVASSLTNVNSAIGEDNGFTQSVNLKTGVLHKETTTLKPRVDLAPFRTFPEIPQPISQFVLRAKCDAQGSAFLMLVEADGGRWKLDAIATLREAVGAFDLNIPIIA